MSESQFTSEHIAAAETLLGLTFSAEQRQQMLSNFERPPGPLQRPPQRKAG